jgi:Glycosyltransferase WbsX/IPT/TIG domain
VKHIPTPPGTNRRAVKARCSASVRGVPSLLVIVLSACGPQAVPISNPTPTLTSISPSTATREGPAFALTVNGSGFVSGSSVQWSGASRPTTFVSSRQLTAKITTADILVAQPYNVAVVNPPPGGGNSNSLPFNVPCLLATQGPASTQTRARIGAYYFDGWAGPLTGFHFSGLMDGEYQGREPLSGWQDNNECAIEQQLAWAHSFGLSFFVFDWYFSATVVDPTEDLNSALNITLSLPDRHGMQFAILYVNNGAFIVEPADWTSAVSQWMSYMTDPGYVQVNGKPLLVVIDMRQMRLTFGSSMATVAAFGELRTTAQAKGLSGVYIAGNFNAYDGSSGIDGLFADLSMAKADGYDAVSMYNYGYAGPLTDGGAQPFSQLSDVGAWIWRQGGLKSPVSFIPVAMDGWDARPIAENEPGRAAFWFTRTPDEVTAFVNEAILWSESNPQVRPEPSPIPPLVFLEAWNEFSEGSYLLPTAADATGYGDSLAAMLASPSSRVRSVLTLSETGPSSASRVASGGLTDANGAPIAGASVNLTDARVGGVYSQQYQLAGQPPVAATQAVVGFRVNSGDAVALWPGYFFAGPGNSDFSLYQVSYVQPADGIQRLPNGDFSSGSASWLPQGEAEVVPSDRGAGQMVHVGATQSQFATLDSLPFPISEGAAFQVTFSARVAPSSLGSGYFFLAFLDASGGVLHVPAESAGALSCESIPLEPGRMTPGTATTDSAGSFQLSLTSLGTSQVILEATYAGDAQHWPSYARVGP